jgi:uncharacterized RDD family membrane protein YckC
MQTDTQLLPRVGVSLWRRLAAIVYDLFALFAVCFVAGAVALLFRHGTAIAPHTWWFTAYLTLACYAYFAYSWRRTQTLGMRSWKLCLQSADGGQITQRQTLVRFIVALISWAPAGLGYWWSLWEPHRRTWHDIASGTVIVHEDH